MTKYSKGLTPSAIQHKYKLTYEQGFELATIINNQQAEINRLREALEKVKNVCTEQDTNIDSLVLAYSICRRALNGESEGK